MRRVRSFAVACALAAGGCATPPVETAPCRDGTVFLTVQFDDVAKQADTINIDITVGKKPPKSVTKPHVAGAARDTFELSFLPDPYPKGQSVVIAVKASRHDEGTKNEVAVGAGCPAAVGLDGSCKAITVNVRGECHLDEHCCMGMHCDLTSFRCVPCVEDNHCPTSGTVCNPQSHKCVPGCTASRGCGEVGGKCEVKAGVCVDCLMDADCSKGSICDPEGHTCVPCTLKNDQCGFNQHCEQTGGGDMATSYVCRPGCKNDDDCRPPSVGSDGGVTSDGGTPDAGAGPMAGRCDITKHVCVECLKDKDCATGTICNAGKCMPGCSDDQMACPGQLKCCKPMCVDTSKDPLNCGVCGKVCPMGNSCCAGNCIDLQSDVSHCGGCGLGCSTVNVPIPRCTKGLCDGVCKAGFDACKMDKLKYGCDTNIKGNDPKNCGGCGIECSKNTIHLINAFCVNGMCNGTCEDGWEDCNNDLGDGCETNIGSAPEHCGSCTYKCSSKNPNATWSCNKGKCENPVCIPPYLHCTMSPGDVCETNTFNSSDHCGKCGMKCMNVVKNGVPGCVKGKCGVGSCKTGFAHCANDAPDECATDILNDVKNCGLCGNVCPTMNHATSYCAMGRCQLQCEPNFLDCDLKPENGCEADITDTKADNPNCGCCGGFCAAGTCILQKSGEYGCAGKGGRIAVIVHSDVHGNPDINWLQHSQVPELCGFDKLDASVTNLSLNQLKGYVAALVVNAPPENGDVLGQYVLAGGRVVAMSSGQLEGSWTNEFALFFAGGAGGKWPSSMNAPNDVPGCPVGGFCPLLRGVNSFNALQDFGSVLTVPGTVVIAGFSNGQPLVVTGKRKGNVQRVDLNIPSINDSYSGDGHALIRNALLYR